MIDMTDRRLISDMQFGFEAGKDLDEEDRKVKQVAVTKGVQETLAFCGCVVADDINRLGCTGTAKAFPESAVHMVQELRIDLAGGGVGLPCFVPPTLFCLGHNTIGGLEDKQKQYHAECVPMISRALTPEEEAKVAATDRVRRMKRTDAEEFIAGRSAAEAEEAVRGGEEAEVDLNQFRLGRPFVWTCEEHTKTDWACRHCLAQAIVEGALEPMLGLVAGSGTADGFTPEMPRLTGAGVEAQLPALNASGTDRAELWVRVATFTRKLSRD